MHWSTFLQPDSLHHRAERRHLFDHGLSVWSSCAFIAAQRKYVMVEVVAQMIIDVLRSCDEVFTRLRRCADLD